MRDRKLLVVTPAKNEAQYLPTTISSMLRQNVLPTQWIIVDDGSKDATTEIAAKAAESASWITVLNKDGDGERRVGLATIQALHLALEQTSVRDWDFLCVIDADVDLPPEYFAYLLGKFDRLPKLGIAAGQIYERVRDGKLCPMRGSPEATAGAVKCWRRECFEQMGGLIEEPGWDGIDQYQAAMHGWFTRTFDDEGLRVLHLRPVGSSHKGILHGRLRRGRSGYFMGSHPIWMLASALFHISDPPLCVGSLFTLKGYLGCAWRRDPQVANSALIAFVRSSQLSILRSKLTPRLYFSRARSRKVPTCQP